MHPLDGVGVDVGGDHLDRGGQVDVDRVLRRRVHDVDDGVADLEGEVQLGTGEGLGGVLPAPVGARVVLGDGLDQLGGVDGQLLDGRLVLAEYHASLQLGGGVVKVDDDVLRALARLEGAADQVLTRLDEHLDGDVLRDHVLLDDLADEVEVGLGGGREADLDLLVAHLDQQVEHAALALGAHRVDEGLVAVTQVDGAPLRGDGDLLVRPGAVRHGGVALLVPGGLAFAAGPVRGADLRGGGDEGVVGGHGASFSGLYVATRGRQWPSL